MLIIGSDDGIYQLTGLREPEPTVTRLHETGRVHRVRTFEDLAGVFAATETGLYHSVDGAHWQNLNVPTEKVYAMGARPDGKRLYAGTRPAHLYVTDLADGINEELTWTELDGFQELPSRDEWRLPRHENLAQVRDVHVPADDPDRVVAGVEVGGVHRSGDGGEHWTERQDGVDSDVHELHVVDSETFYAATGGGLYQTEDAGHSWTRLDEEYDQRYFRRVFSAAGTVYASGALANSSTWNDSDADPALFVFPDGETAKPVDHPRPEETITGFTDADGTVFAATHRGTVLRTDSGDWTVVGSFPVPGDVTGRYTPLCWQEEWQSDR